MTSVSFIDKDSYIRLPKIDFQSAVNITITLKTDSSPGLILYTGQEQHLSVELFRGRVAVSFYIGEKAISTMYSYIFSFMRVDDDKLHVLELLLQKQNFTMRVDGGMARTVVNEGGNKYLDVDDDVYLGGISEEKSREAVHKFQIRDKTSFRG